MVYPRILAILLVVLGFFNLLIFVINRRQGSGPQTRASRRYPMWDEFVENADENNNAQPVGFIVTEYMTIPWQYEGPIQRFVPLDMAMTLNYCQRIRGLMGVEEPIYFNPNNAVWKEKTFLDSQISWYEVLGASSIDEDTEDYYCLHYDADELNLYIVAAHCRNEERVLAWFDANGIPPSINAFVTPRKWETYNFIYHFLVSNKKIHHVADLFFFMN